MTAEKLVREELLRSQAALHELLLCLCARPQDVDDLLQKTNLEILLHAHEYNPALPALPWFKGFAANIVREWRKERNDRVTFDSNLAELLANKLAEPQFRTDGRAGSLELCMEKLPGWQRELLERRHIAGTRLRDLVMLFHVSASSLSKTLAKIRNALRNCIMRNERRAAQPDVDGFLRDMEEVFDGSAGKSVRRRFTQALENSAELRELYLAQVQIASMLLRSGKNTSVKRRRLRLAVPIAAASLAAMFAIASPIVFRKNTTDATTVKQEKEMKTPIALALAATVATVAQTGQQNTAPRNITGLAIDASTQTATVEFDAGESGSNHVLYYAWSADGVDKGEDIAAWPHVIRTGRIADAATVATIALPAAAQVTDVYACRAFIAASDAAYDYLVDGLTSSTAGGVTAAGGGSGCHFDTGFYPIGGKTVLAMDCQLLAPTVQQYMFSARDVNSKLLTFCSYINGSGYWAYSCAEGNNDWQASTLKASTSARVQLHLDSTQSSSKFTVQSGSTTYTKTSTVAHKTTSPSTIYLFASHKNNTTGVENWTKATVYSCSITNDGECVRNYLPAVKDSVYGFYDTVNNTFGASGSSTAFTGGTNTSYSVESGDTVVGVSSAWTTEVTTDWETDEPTVDARSVTSSTGGSKSGAAPLTLTGANDFGGRFTVMEGTLVADFGQGLASSDNLLLAGGSYRPATATFTPSFGAGGGQIQAQSGGVAGFSAYGGPLSITVGESAEETWSPSSPFNPQTLILNDAYATDEIAIQNPFACDTASLNTLIVSNNTARFARDFSATGTAELRKYGTGVLAFDGDVSIAPYFRASQGGVTFNGDTSFGGLLASNATTVVFNNVDAIHTGVGGNVVTYGNANVEIHGGSFASTNSSGNVSVGILNSTAKATAKLLLDDTKFNCGMFYGGNGSSATSYNNVDVVVTNGSEVSFVTNVFRKGTFSQYEGTRVTVANEFRMGSEYKVNGWALQPNYYLYGGTLEVTNSFTLGYTQQNNAGIVANMYVYGGTALLRGSVILGASQFDTGNVYVKDGGSFTLVKSGETFNVGNNYGSGRLEISDGGAVTVNGAVLALSGAGSTARTGVVTVGTNGTLTARSVKSTCSAEVGVATLTLDGGKVVVGASSETDFITGFENAYVGAAGIVIDTNGRNANIPQDFTARAGQTYVLDTTQEPTVDDLLAAPALTKSGSGKLTLSGANTYACATCVSNGVLVISGESSLPPTTTLRLAQGSVLDLGGETRTVANLVGRGVVSNGTLEVTGTVYPGAGDSGVLEFNDATLVASKLSYSFDESGEVGRLKLPHAFNLDGVNIAVSNADRRKENGMIVLEATTLTGTPTRNGSGNTPLQIGRERIRVGVSGTVISLI